MCGIVGQWNKTENIDYNLFNQMRDTLSHRGPDGCGTYISANYNLALGHRRLSFLDLSTNAQQPISNEDGKIMLSINGEIYNYKKLRCELQNAGHFFKSESDSEIIVHAYEQWGIEMVNMLEGMFAFALWDENKQKLFLARDKFGIKPLFYYFDNEKMIFASEIKGIIKNKSVKREISYKSLCEFLTYRYVPSPNTIFEDIYKIKPAYYLEFTSPNKFTEKEYYKFKIGEDKISLKKLVCETDKILSESVKAHIQSDVPIGSFLSGGYDSTLIAKYYADNITPFNTFSIGFKNWKKSEHQYAEKVAKIFRTSHESLIVDESAFDNLEKLMYYFDDPIADISIIPTFLISQKAAKKNKAVLSGEGADEIFAGYTWHKKYLWDIPKIQKLKYKLLRWQLPENKFDVDSYAKVMEMGKFDNEELKKLLPENLHQFIPQNSLSFYQKYYDSNISIPKRFQILDIKGFMSELVLTKIDRASMANSLEVRVPFLNSAIFEMLLNTSSKVYFDKRQQKIVIYKILKKVIPHSILKRKKQGFVGPDSYYTNFDKYREFLSDSELIKHNIIKQSAINEYFEHKEYWKLWKISILEMWYRQWFIKQI